MITIKFFESRMFMKIKKGTLMGEIYGRVARWIGVAPGLIRLSGKLNPNGEKVTNIEPNILALDDTNRIALLKLKVQDSIQYNLKVVKNRDDFSQIKRLTVGGSSI
jgi:hypothetical protein